MLTLHLLVMALDQLCLSTLKGDCHQYGIKLSGYLF